MCLKGKVQRYVNIGVGAWDLFLPSFLQEIFTEYLVWGYKDEQDKFSLLEEPDAYINNQNAICAEIEICTGCNGIIKIIYRVLIEHFTHIFPFISHSNLMR